MRCRCRSYRRRASSFSRLAGCGAASWAGVYWTALSAFPRSAWSIRCCLPSPSMELRLERLRVAEEVALALADAELSQQRELASGFDSFRGDRRADLLGEADERRCERTTRRVCFDLARQTQVELDDVRG